jgi:hypothetical protein
MTNTFFFLKSCLPISDFRLLQWLITDVNSVLWLLHRVDVGNVADISEVHAASIFRIEVWISEFLCTGFGNESGNLATLNIVSCWVVGRTLLPPSRSRWFTIQLWCGCGMVHIRHLLWKLITKTTIVTCQRCVYFGIILIFHVMI